MAYKSQEYYQARMEAECESRPDYSNPVLVSGSACKSRYQVTHVCGLSFEVSYPNFTSTAKSGCPHCRRAKWARTFFLTVSKGKPACLYVVRSLHGGYAKIGVSTWDLYRRHVCIRAATPFVISDEILPLLSGSPSDVVRAEQYIKSACMSAGFSGFSGATEWLIAESLDKIMLDWQSGAI